MVRAHVFVSGRVQGVFFRDTTRQKARELGVRGWVRNLRDGRVEAVYEADRETLEDMIEWTREGPPDARVEDVEIHWEDPEGLEGFDIRPTSTEPEPVVSRGL